MKEDLASSQTEVLVSIGQLLKDARRKKGLSVQDVADQMRRAPGIIEDIEADHFSSEEPTSFERMYIRAYARVVGVAEQQIDQIFKQMGVKTGQAAIKPLQFKPESTGSKANMRLATFLIVGVLIFLVVIWYSLHHESSTNVLPPADNTSLQVTTGVGTDNVPPAGIQQPVQDAANQVSSEPSSQRQNTSDQERSTPTSQSTEKTMPTDTTNATKPTAKDTRLPWQNPDVDQKNENE